jgi:hypothetical protein
MEGLPPTIIYCKNMKIENISVDALFLVENQIRETLVLQG